MNVNGMGTSGSKDSGSNQQQQPQQQQHGGASLQNEQQSQTSSMRPLNDEPKPSNPAYVGGTSLSQGGGSSQYTNGSVYSNGTTSGWIAETDQKIIASGELPNGYSTAPVVPEGTSNKGCEPCVHPPKCPTGMKFFLAMRKEWRTKVINPPPALTIDDVDPDDIADAIEDTPGDILEPPVPVPVMLDILIDIWEDSGLYD